MKMILPTAREVARVLSLLDRRAFHRLSRVVLRLPPDADAGELPVKTQLKMYAYEWLLHLGFLQEDRVRWLMDRLDTPCDRVAHDVHANWPGDAYPHMLSIMDRRYARLPFGDTWDMETEAAAGSDVRLVTYYSVDLPALFYQKQTWLRKLQGGSDDQLATAGPAARREGPPGAARQ